MNHRDRRRAEELQQALERYERALAEGKKPAKARSEALGKAGALGKGGMAGDGAKAFMLATALTQAAAPIPEPKHVAMFSQRLRKTQVVHKRQLGLAPRRSFAPLAVAASVVAAAAILIPSFRSLPGEGLYAVKGFHEDARVWLATGPREGRVRLGLADERLEEVGTLLSRSRLEAAGPGLVAAGVAQDITDVDLAHLIDSTLQEAGRQLEAAADILTRASESSVSEASVSRSDEDLDELVEISQRGQSLAKNVAEDLPAISKAPVFQTGVKLAKIEAKAKAARTRPVPEPTPPPCDVPTPTPSAVVDDGTSTEPTATPEPTSTPESTDAPEPTSDGETLTPPPAEPTPSPTSTPTPTATPQATPCTTPEPTPTPSPSPTHSSEPGSSPTVTPDSEASTASDQDGQDVEVAGTNDETPPEGAPNPDGA